MNYIRKIHKWASVIIGIQFMLWLLSGLFFNIMDHTKSAGKTYKNNAPQLVNIEQALLIEPMLVLQNSKPSIELEQIQLLANPYYLLTHTKGLYKNFVNHYSLVDAYTGELFSIDKNVAIALAKQSYSGPGEVLTSTLLPLPLDDYPKQKNATWQVNFSDDINTSVYIEAESGRVVGHSDDDKRFADIFFMLHFMDYTNEGGFNSWHNMLCAVIALWLCLTGLIWTVNLGMKGGYKF